MNADASITSTPPPLYCDEPLSGYIKQFTTNPGKFSEFDFARKLPLDV
jgi:hypothetical protein